jgi:methylenetetrahydrofolate--tRNA-(uracil-5-)-methyltransferase
MITQATDANGTIHIIGAGLAGSEAAWQAAQAGAQVVLHEMRPHRTTEAHLTGDFAELVCSNSFRSDDSDNNAVGLIHHEMRAMNSLILRCADAHTVPAGSALAVDRNGFSAAVTAEIQAHSGITIVHEEVSEDSINNWKNVIICSGPLTSPGLAEAIQRITGEDQLAFFDAIAPIVYKDSIDLSKAWFQSRYDKVGPGGGVADYINCPLDKDQYAAFVDGLNNGEVVEFKQWEGTPYFSGCLPIEVMASRGVETLRHGPMKPFGLTNPHANAEPGSPNAKAYAVIQLRQDNALGTLYNMVGFQTKLKHAEQIRLFRTIPGLENAEFARLGGLHRNTFINSPVLLDNRLRLKNQLHLRFAGQITGCEGYVESAATGLIAGRMAAAEILGKTLDPPPVTTALGALLNHITGGHIETIDAGPPSFQPMNVNFGLFPPTSIPETSPEGKRLRGPEKGAARKRALTARAKRDMAIWLEQNSYNGAG